jgi:ketosteroid isomerase-like protein
MKYILFVFSLILFSSCKENQKEQWKSSVLFHEKAFEAMLKKEGIPQAFAFYADSNAIIKRGDDKLIQGKKAIFEYYSSEKFNHVELSWTPDFIDVSDDGTMAYTYGKYVWKEKLGVDTFQTIEGVFHTVWKKQKDGSWKYVWD